MGFKSHIYARLRESMHHAPFRCAVLARWSLHNQGEHQNNDRANSKMFKQAFFAAFAVTLAAVFAAALHANAQSIAVNPETNIFDYGEELLRGPVHEAFAEQYNQEAVEGIVVDRAPPPLVPEIPPDVKPEGENIEWVSGYWFWDEDRRDFIWISGVWRQMPPGQRWVPGYWADLNGRHQWVGGTWVSTTVTEVGYIAQSPPESLELGPVGNAPTEQHFWIPGCWTWRDANYAWRPGYWSAGYTNWVWVPQRYLWTPRGYVFCNGYWDYPIASRGTLFAPFWFNRPVYNIAGFHYAPRLSLLVSGLQAHFWISPRYGHYYFGDYYASSYRGLGIYPWHSFHLRPTLQIGGHGLIGYDPLFAHTSRIYGNRGVNITQIINNQYNIYVDQSDRRPPRSYSEQIGRRRSFPTYSRDQRGDDFWRRGDVLGESIQELATRDPSHFTRISGDQVERYRNQASQIPQIASLRREAETRGRGRYSSARPAATADGETLPSPSTRPSRLDSESIPGRDPTLEGIFSDADGSGRWRLPAANDRVREIGSRPSAGPGSIFTDRAVTRESTPKRTRPGVQAPETDASGETRPNIFPPRTATPERTRPSVPPPRMSVPRELRPNIFTPRVTMPQSIRPSVQSPAASAPRESRSNIFTPRVNTPSASAPSPFRSPAVQTPRASSRPGPTFDGGDAGRGNGIFSGPSSGRPSMPSIDRRPRSSGPPSTPSVRDGSSVSNSEPEGGSSRSRSGRGRP